MIGSCRAGDGEKSPGSLSVNTHKLLTPCSSFLPKLVDFTSWTELETLTSVSGSLVVTATCIKPEPANGISPDCPIQKSGEQFCTTTFEAFSTDSSSAFLNKPCLGQWNLEQPAQASLPNLQFVTGDLVLDNSICDTNVVYSQFKKGTNSGPPQCPNLPKLVSVNGTTVLVGWSMSCTLPALETTGRLVIFGRQSLRMMKIKEYGPGPEYTTPVSYNGVEMFAKLKTVGLMVQNDSNVAPGPWYDFLVMRGNTSLANDQMFNTSWPWFRARARGAGYGMLACTVCPTINPLYRGVFFRPQQTTTLYLHTGALFEIVTSDAQFSGWYIARQLNAIKGDAIVDFGATRSSDTDSRSVAFESLFASVTEISGTLSTYIRVIYSPDGSIQPVSMFSSLIKAGGVSTGSLSENLFPGLCGFFQYVNLVDRLQSCSNFPGTFHVFLSAFN